MLTPPPPWHQQGVYVLVQLPAQPHCTMLYETAVAAAAAENSH